MENLKEVEFSEVEYDDTKESQDVRIGELLNYPSAADDLYGPPPEDMLTEIDSLADDSVRLM